MEFKNIVVSVNSDAGKRVPSTFRDPVKNTRGFFTTPSGMTTVKTIITVKFDAVNTSDESNELVFSGPHNFKNRVEDIPAKSEKSITLTWSHDELLPLTKLFRVTMDMYEQLALAEELNRAIRETLVDVPAKGGSRRMQKQKRKTQKQKKQKQKKQKKTRRNTRR